MGDHKKDIDISTMEGLHKVASTLVNATQADNDTEAANMVAVLLGGSVIDLRRIAVAIEKLASFKLERVGDIAVMQAAGVELHNLTASEVAMLEAARMALEQGPSGTTALASLTADEMEMVEALRAGTIEVRPIKAVTQEQEKLAIDLFHAYRYAKGLKPMSWHDLSPDTQLNWLDKAAHKIANKPTPTDMPPEKPWLHWSGDYREGPPRPVGCLVDLRFRKPSKGDRLPDAIGADPDKQLWLNTSRPTNADIEFWRISDKKRD